MPSNDPAATLIAELEFVNHAPQDKEWSAHIRLLNSYPKEIILRNIIQYARSGSFYPANMHVDLIEQYFRAYVEAVKPAAIPIIKSHPQDHRKKVAGYNDGIREFEQALLAGLGNDK